jgi:hypothetical protein
MNIAGFKRLFREYAKNTARKRMLQRAKVGGTAGAVVNAADNKNSAVRVPASQTAATIIFPIEGIPNVSRIKSYTLVGQIESAGNTVTVDCELRYQEAAAADNTDNSVSSSSITQVSATADTALSSTNAKKTFSESLPELEDDRTYYFKITITTGASTDVDILGILLEYYDE